MKGLGGHFWSINRVYILQNANNLNFKLIYQYQVDVDKRRATEEGGGYQGVPQGGGQEVPQGGRQGGAGQRGGGRQQQQQVGATLQFVNHQTGP